MITLLVMLTIIMLFLLLISSMPDSLPGIQFQQALGWQVIGFVGFLLGYFAITRIFCGNKCPTDSSTP